MMARLFLDKRSWCNSVAVLDSSNFEISSKICRYHCSEKITQLSCPERFQKRHGSQITEHTVEPSYLFEKLIAKNLDTNYLTHRGS